ncbi:hypothetical protein [Paraburkholderia sp. BCC1876]|uniref:hypothetical protein n=1 Tax=Paraburkholderia sp. BCC1876 TaxID=2676303 RepID=UPI001590FE51|nr:hypothetical protein [Paraburkholderia sp. BCC1876]
MDNILDYRPIALDRPRGAHRLEAFSLKADRRLTLYRQSAFEQWVILEADPAVTAFCERPGFIQAEGKRYLADFWARYFDRQELVILFDSISESPAKPDTVLDKAGLALRSVQSSEIAASRVWIANWKRMLPCLVATRGLIPPSLSSAIERFVARPHRLLSIEREFTTGDPVLVRSAVFGLLHAGRVQAPELRTHELSLLTEFVAVGEPS